MEPFVVPDIYGGSPLHAWRAWTCEFDENKNLVLNSINQVKAGKDPFRWHPRQIMEATCNKEDREHALNETPAEGCRCGIHALDHPLYLAKQGYPSFIGPKRTFYVWGELAMWGKVIEGETGIKAQFAYPTKFYIRYDLHLDWTKDGKTTKLDPWMVRDILEHQWGIPTTVVWTLKRLSQDSPEIVIKEYPEP